MPEEDDIMMARPLSWVDIQPSVDNISRAFSNFSFSIEGTSTPVMDDYKPEAGENGTIRCVCARCVERRDVGRSTILEHRRRAREEETDRLNTEVIACQFEGCDENAARGTMQAWNSGYVCRSHVENCSYCGRNRLSTYMRDVMRPGYRAPMRFCSNCVHDCQRCGTATAENDMRTTYDGPRLCYRCTTVCDDCGHYMETDGECYRCEHRITGLSGYGKTHPNYWLGGPLPKDKKGADRGYYLGFELEVSASKGNVKVLHEWAQEALGYSDAIDCKEDSSVMGFEIATQPMTPEFFESVDWDKFFEVLNKKFPLPNRKRTEPEGHGLHVHIGRAAFAKDDIAMAAFCYLIGQSSHLERIARRKPTSYCNKVTKPVSTAIRALYNETGGMKYQRQASKAQRNGVFVDRSAINLLNTKTIEIRAFRSTRKSQDLKDAVRLVYVAAEYIRYLRFSNTGVPPKALHWTEFTKWVGANYPDAYESIADMRKRKLPIRRG